MAKDMRVLVTTALLLLFLVTCGLGKEPAAVGSKQLLPARADATFLCGADPWVVWRTSELIESTRKHRAPSYVYRFYRQRIGEEQAVLVHQMTDVLVPMLGTVTANGAFVLANRRILSWHKPAGSSRRHAEYLPVISLYPDGALLHDTAGTERDRHPVTFVPFKNGRLDERAKAQIVPTGAKRFYRRGEPRRHGNLFAWISASTLHVYDLKTRKVTSTKLSATLHESYAVTAFDGLTAVASVYVYDAKTGEIVGQKDYSEMPAHFASVFAVRNRIGYYVQKGQLLATDLSSPTGRSVRLARIGKKGAYFESRDGLRLWNGEEWQLIRWLKKWPATAR